MSKFYKTAQKKFFWNNRERLNLRSRLKTARAKAIEELARTLSPADVAKIDEHYKKLLQENTNLPTEK